MLGLLNRAVIARRRAGATVFLADRVRNRANVSSPLVWDGAHHSTPQAGSRGRRHCDKPGEKSSLNTKGLRERAAPARKAFDVSVSTRQMEDDCDR